MGGNHATHPEPFTELAWPKGEVPGWRDGYETGDGPVTTTANPHGGSLHTLRRHNPTDRLQVPTVLRQDGFRVIVFLPPREHGPPHVDVQNTDGEVVIELATTGVPQHVGESLT